MNRELLQAIYDHRAICTAVEQRQEEHALELWAEKARLLRQAEPAERSAMLEALSQSLYDHILRVQGNAPAEFRHTSREMYTRTLPQTALVGHGAEMIRQYIRRMNEDGRQDDHIRMACCYITTHLSEPFTLETVAKHVFVSKCYLCRMFRSQTGQSFSSM